MEIEYLLHRAALREKAIEIAGHGLRDVVEIGERRIQRSRSMKRWKRAREQFANGLGLGKRNDFVPVSVLKHKNTAKLYFFRRSEARFPVPGRSVHPQCFPLFPQNDSIVAQNLRISHRLPEHRGSALTRARMPHKQMPSG